MERMLITPTLLNSFRWYSHFYGEEPEDETIQRGDFLRMLRREPMEAPGEAILRGIELENDIVEYCKCGGYDEARKDIREIGNKMMGAGLWQQTVKRELDGYLLYGRSDRVQLDTFRDVKFSRTYDIGKFLRSAQHRIYLYCAREIDGRTVDNPIERFIYDISDGWNTYEEEYRYTATTDDEIRGQIDDFIGFLNDDHEARELFNTHWKALS